jgi:spore coat protein U-like protein
MTIQETIHMKKMITIAAGSLALAPAVASATLGTSTIVKPLSVSATIVAGCTLLTVTTPLAFGSTLAPGSGATAAGALSTTCARSVVGVLTFDNGLNPGTSPVAPNLTSTGTVGGALIPYTVQSALGTAVVAGGISVTGTGTAVTTTIFGSVTGVIPQDQVPGVYSDTVSVTLNY